MCIALLLGPATDSLQPLISATVTFPKSGPVSIEGIVKQGAHPRLVFHSQQTGQLLLDAQVGKSEYWKEFVDKYQPNDLNMSIRFLVLHRIGLPDPLILALVREQGGSDCGYNSALFGEVDGRLSELTPSLPDHWFRGQTLLSSGTSGGPITLTVTSERYQAKDVHYTGPSLIAVYVYTYDSSQGKFVEARRTEVKSDDLHSTGEDLIGLFGEFAQC